MSKGLQRYRFVVELTAPAYADREKYLTSANNVVAKYVHDALESHKGSLMPDEAPIETSITNVAVKNYSRVLQAEKAKAGLRSKQLHLRVKQNDLRDALAMLIDDVPGYNALCGDQMDRVDRIAHLLEEGGASC
jgi:hypothetical protein